MEYFWTVIFVWVNSEILQQGQHNFLTQQWPSSYGKQHLEQDVAGYGQNNQDGTHNAHKKTGRVSVVPLGPQSWLFGPHSADTLTCNKPLQTSVWSFNPGIFWQIIMHDKNHPDSLLFLIINTQSPQNGAIMLHIAPFLEWRLLWNVI